MGNVARYQVMLGDKRHEALSALTVSRVPSLHTEVEHTLANLNILCSSIVKATQFTIINTILKSILTVNLERRSKAIDDNEVEKPLFYIYA